MKQKLNPKCRSMFVLGMFCFACHSVSISEDSDSSVDSEEKIQNKDTEEDRNEQKG